MNLIMKFRQYIRQIIIIFIAALFLQSCRTNEFTSCKKCGEVQVYYAPPFCGSPSLVLELNFRDSTFVLTGYDKSYVIGSLRQKKDTLHMFDMVECRKPYFEGESNFNPDLGGWSVDTADVRYLTVSHYLVFDNHWLLEVEEININGMIEGAPEKIIKSIQSYERVECKR